MLSETYESEIPFLKFKTKEGVRVEVVLRHWQTHKNGEWVFVGALVISASFKPKAFSKAKLVYTNKIMLDDFINQRDEIVNKCQKEEYEKAVNKKIKNKEERTNEFKNKYMLHDVGDEFIFRGIDKAQKLTVEKILGDSSLFASFLRDFKK